MFMAAHLLRCGIILDPTEVLHIPNLDTKKYYSFELTKRRISHILCVADEVSRR